MSQSMDKVPSSSGLPAVTTESDSCNNGSDAAKCCPVLDQLNSEMEHVNIGSTMESCWDVIARSSENQAVAKVTQWESSTVTRSGWGHSVTTPTNLDSEPINEYEKQDAGLDDDYDFPDDDDDFPDDDDDFLNEDYDSDASEKSHETRKKNKWLRSLFEVLNSLNEEQINDTNRRWQCPACHDGPGAIAYYWGLQPLISHAKTKGTRIKLHRELAALLEDELRRRGASIPTKCWENKSASVRNPQKNWEAVDRGNSTCQQPNRGCNEANAVSPRVLPPSLHHQWQGGQGDGSTSTLLKTPEGPTNDRSAEDSLSAYDSEPNILPEKQDDPSDDDYDDDFLDDNDHNDEYDILASKKSHETRKKNRRLKSLFDALDSLEEEEINDPNRRWHCPACHDGPGAIAYYRGLGPLISHAKTRGTRIKLHRELAVLLEEELQRRGTSVVLGDGKQKDLHGTTADHKIVWPPMVIVMNTLLTKDENDKKRGDGKLDAWAGKGSQQA